ncbi:cupin domain-containing protein [Roseateles chitinivorans]|uniref:AraC family transcriptional regulator n=1 Tax=Roseateles chitinivorans TaxID=2917965 RepID=UPI003D675168
MSIDLLSAVLRDTGLSRRLLDLSELSEDCALRFPCDRSIGLHVVLRGSVVLHAPELEKPLTLNGGDIAVMSRGHPHVLSLRPTLDGQRVDDIDMQRTVALDTLGPSGTPDETGAVVLSGAYQFWHTPLHPFFAELPIWAVLRAADMPRLGPLALAGGLLVEELREAEPGAEIITHGLLDLLFTYALRQLIARRAATSVGWSLAVQDPTVGRAVALMHGDPSHPWTLEALAKRVGLSRTALAERFREAMGDTPLNHLRIVRMQRAMQLLAQTRHSLEAVAAAVGYRDAFGFSKVFKRTVGKSPKAFRQQDAAEREDPWRLSAG